MNEFDQTKNHVIEKFESSELIHTPFDHKFVENVFPKDFYKKIISNIPSKSDFVPIVETGLVGKGYSPERFVFNLLDTQLIAKLDLERRNFFRSLLDIILSKELFISITSQFFNTLKKRIDNFSELEKKQLGTSDLKFTKRTALIKDFTKYSLGAHTDAIHKLISFLFYLPSDDNLSKVGTSLYESKKDVIHHRHHSREDTNKLFNKIKTCPFIPNSVLVFPRTHNSFHGVEEVNIEQKERNLLQLNYFFQAYGS